MPAAETTTLPAFSLIAGENTPIAGDSLSSHNPANPSQVLWSGSPTVQHVERAVAAARTAFDAWSGWPIERRAEALRRFAELAHEHKDELAALITRETGKPLWDAAGEAGLIGPKVQLAMDETFPGGLARVRGYELSLTETKRGVCSFRPHGVAAVLGPFNFPAHLPNGHIVPALLLGDTVVFKPSDKTPATGQFYGSLMQRALTEAGAPAGTFNLVHGAADVASRLSSHEGVDCVLFTGSWPVARKILQANLDTPGRLVAVELGGNNPAVVLGDADLRQAVIECVRCAFITAGQRCTCTRRIIVDRTIADRFIAAFTRAAQAILPGDPVQEGTFLGPVIRPEPRDAALAFAQEAVKQGAEAVLAPRVTEVDGCPGGYFMTPGVLRVDGFDEGHDGPGRDEEFFAPLTRISVVDGFDAALEQANATGFGLAASIFTSDQSKAEAFVRRSKAGCVNVNTGTAGASGKLPFGGLGWSGNHRPAGAFSHDYCVHPVASMIESGAAAALAPGLAFDDSWLA